MSMLPLLVTPTRPSPQSSAGHPQGQAPGAGPPHKRGRDGASGAARAVVARGSARVAVRMTSLCLQARPADVTPDAVRRAEHLTIVKLKIAGL